MAYTQAEQMRAVSEIGTAFCLFRTCPYVASTNAYYPSPLVPVQEEIRGISSRFYQSDLVKQMYKNTQNKKIKIKISCNVWLYGLGRFCHCRLPSAQMGQSVRTLTWRAPRAPRSPPGRTPTREQLCRRRKSPLRRSPRYQPRRPPCRRCYPRLPRTENLRSQPSSL